MGDNLLDRISISRAVESVVADWLRKDGWSDIHNLNDNSVESEIEAKRGVEIALIKVKTSFYPLDPGSLTSEERVRIQNRAHELGATPHFIRMCLNEDLTPRSHHLTWRKL